VVGAILSEKRTEKVRKRGGFQRRETRNKKKKRLKGTGVGPGETPKNTYILALWQTRNGGDKGRKKASVGGFWRGEAICRGQEVGPKNRVREAKSEGSMLL